MGLKVNNMEQGPGRWRRRRLVDGRKKKTGVGLLLLLWSGSKQADKRGTQHLSPLDFDAINHSKVIT